MKIVHFLQLIILLSFLSCSKSPLQKALDRAGENRKEMEKVLEHFSQNRNDSLKYKAACFLIENMLGHTTYDNRLIYKYIDSTRNAIPNSAHKWATSLQAELYYIHRQKLSAGQYIEEIEDIKTLNSDFVIQHIESVFRHRDNSVWLKDFTIEDFFEYVLPYRIDHERPALWRDSVIKGLEYVQEQIDIYDDVRTSALNLSKRMKHLINTPVNEVNDILPPLMTPYKEDCVDESKRELLLRRLCNIPAAIDLVPCWGNYNGWHIWMQTIDKRRRYTTNLENFSWITVPKVYRKTYSLQKSEYIGEEFIPPFFKDRHLKDVTAEYINTKQVIINHFPRSVKYGYLCVFNLGTWIPVAQATNKSGVCTFNDIGPGVVYLPAYYNKFGDQIPLSDPFTLENTGEKDYHIPSKNETIDISIKRKYPLNKLLFIEPITDFIIIASNSKKFKECDTIRMNKKLFMQPVTINFNQPYRFFRVMLFHGTSIAEIYFYNEKKQRVTARIENGDINDQFYQDDNVLSYASNPSTCFSIDEKHNGVTDITIVPVNDGNGIYPNNEYVLLYFDKDKGWISCGKTVSDSFVLHYRHVL